jgi:hypothetical protein
MIYYYKYYNTGHYQSSFYLKQDVSETGFALCLQVGLFLIDPIKQLISVYRLKTLSCFINLPVHCEHIFIRVWYSDSNCGQVLHTHFIYPQRNLQSHFGPVCSIFKRQARFQFLKFLSLERMGTEPPKPGCLPARRVDRSDARKLRNIEINSWNMKPH